METQQLIQSTKIPAKRWILLFPLIFASSSTTSNISEFESIKNGSIFREQQHMFRCNIKCLFSVLIDRLPFNVTREPFGEVGSLMKFIDIKLMVKRNHFVRIHPKPKLRVGRLWYPVSILWNVIEFISLSSDGVLYWLQWTMNVDVESLMSKVRSNK